MAPADVRASWKWSLVFWSGPIVLSTLASYASAREAGDAVSAARALWLGFSAWMVWPFLTPGIVALGQRWPLDRRTRRWRALPAHVAAAAATGVFATAVTAVASYDSGSGRAFAEVVQSRVLLRSPMGATLYFIILGVSYLAVNTRRLRDEELRAERLSRELNEAQLAALRSQLQPHFLFNSLNAVMALVRDQDTERADRALTLVSDFLRSALAEDRGPTIPLTRELAFVRNYLEIEELRFGDRLRVVLAIPEECGQAQVPAFLLQPLVENALRHGLLDRPAGGSVWITAEKHGATLQLSVRDDGSGLPLGWENAARRGVGIRNIEARLTHLYAAAASLVMAPGPGRIGTSAVVRLPFESQP